MQLIFEDENHRAKVLDRVITPDTEDMKHTFVYIDKSVIDSLKNAKKLDNVQQFTMEKGSINPDGSINLKEYKVTVIKELILYIHISENLREIEWEITLTQEEKASVTNSKNVTAGVSIYTLPGKVTREGNNIICSRNYT